MIGEILCVGTELLLGDTLNSNAQYLSRRLAELGLDVYYESVVGDNFDRLQASVQTALGRSDVVIITGGLGPTEDDLTKEAICALLNLPLVEDKASLRSIEDYFKKSGRQMSPNNAKQALRPKGATVLFNDNGTAPGYIIPAGKNKQVILLPGPPAEMQRMFENHVQGFLAKRSDKSLVSHNILVTGIGESMLADLLAPYLQQQNPTVSPYAGPGQVVLRVTSSGKSRTQCEKACRQTVDELCAILGPNVVGVDVESLQHGLVEQLKAQGVKLATAESCTAGMLSAKLTDVPGASEVFEIGISAYSNEIKRDALGVTEETLQRYGAVSPQTAAAMAVGIRKLSGSHIGLSVTGVAGPDPSEGKPVGLVYVGMADKERIWVLQLSIAGGEHDRNRVREVAAKNALDLCRRYLCAGPEGLPGYTLYNQPVQALTLQSIVPLPQLPQAAPTEEMPAKAPAETAAVVEVTEETTKQTQTSLQFTEDPEPETSAQAQPSTESTEEDVAPAKTPWYTRFLRNLIPTKGDSGIEIARKIIFDIALAVFIGCAIYLIVYFSATVSQNIHLSNAREVWNAHLQDDSRNSDGSFARFDVLKNMNSDIKGWITISDTKVDNPVYQTDNNKFYVNHNMSKQKSRYGALFIDSAAKLTAEYTSQNLVIYGHHMQDGSMFANLNKYRKLEFYKEHPTIQFDTLFAQGEYKIFSVFVTNAAAAQNNGYVFNYRAADFETQDAFMLWVDSIQRRSILQTTVDVQPGDQLITLSTCVYDFDDARLVVVARRVREDESVSVNLVDATYAEEPLYPQAWYDKYGGTPPGYVDPEDTSSWPEDEYIPDDLPFEDPTYSEGSTADDPEPEPEPEISTPTSSNTVTSTPVTSATTSTPSQIVTSTPADTTSTPESNDTATSAPTETSAPAATSTPADTSTSSAAGSVAQ